jgi:hypothetical protein
MENKEKVIWQFCYVGVIPECRFCGYSYSKVPPLYTKGSKPKSKRRIKMKMFISELEPMTIGRIIWIIMLFTIIVVLGTIHII